MASDESKFNVESSIADITTRTKTIVCNGNQTNYWYVSDLYTTYKNVYAQSYISLNSFISILKALNNYVLSLNTKNPELSVLSHLNMFKKDKVAAIHNMNAGFRIEYNLLSDSDSEILYSKSAAKDVRAVMSGNVEELATNFNLYTPLSNTLLKAAYDYSTCKTKNHPSKKHYVGSYEKNKKFKNNKITASTKQPTFEEIKAVILDSFSHGLVIPVSSVNQAICKSSGAMFSYKTAPCGKYKHPHSSLTKYLLCCSDIVELRTHNTSYIVKLGPDAQALAERRVLVHLKSDPNNPWFMYRLEYAAINMFACKCTVPMDDFLALFKDIYKISFQAFTNMEVCRFINTQIASKNFLVTKTNRKAMVTCIPTFDEDHKDHSNENILEGLYRSERKCIHNAITDDNIPLVETSIASSEVFLNKTMAMLMKMADNNVPRCLQEPILDFNANEVKEQEFSPAWFYVQHSLPLNGRFLYLEE